MLIAYGLGLRCIAHLSYIDERRSITEYPSGEVLRLVQQWRQSPSTALQDEEEEEGMELSKLKTKAAQYLMLAQASQENDLLGGGEHGGARRHIQRTEERNIRL